MKFVIKSQVREVVLPASTPMTSSFIGEETGESRGEKRQLDPEGVVPTGNVGIGDEQTAQLIVQSPCQNTSIHSEDEDSMIKKRRVLPFKPKKFRPEWMMYDIFKDWLRPHPNPENAMCAACDTVVKAGKSELEKHAAGKKHLKNLSFYRKEMGLTENEVIVISGQELDEHMSSAFLQSNGVYLLNGKFPLN